MTLAKPCRHAQPHSLGAMTHLAHQHLRTCTQPSKTVNTIAVTRCQTSTQLRRQQRAPARLTRHACVCCCLELSAGTAVCPPGVGPTCPCHSATTLSAARWSALVKCCLVIKCPQISSVSVRRSGTLWPTLNSAIGPDYCCFTPTRLVTRCHSERLSLPQEGGGGTVVGISVVVGAGMVVGTAVLPGSVVVGRRLCCSTYAQR